MLFSYTFYPFFSLKLLVILIIAILTEPFVISDHLFFVLFIILFLSAFNITFIFFNKNPFLKKFCIFLTFLNFYLLFILTTNSSKENNNSSKEFPLVINGFMGTLIEYPVIKKNDLFFISCYAFKGRVKENQNYIIKSDFILNQSKQWIAYEGYIKVSSKNILENLKKGQSVLIFSKAFSIPFLKKNNKEESCSNQSRLTYINYLENKRIHYSSFPSKDHSFIIILKNEDSWNYWKNQSRKKIKDIFKNIPPINQDLLFSFIFGDKQIKKSIEQDFQAIGVNHILAISGMHVAFMTLFFYLFGSFFRISKSFIFLFICLFLFFYIQLINFKAPILRASLLFFYYTLCFFLKKDFFFTNALYISSIIILLIDPYYLYDIGFQFSFLASLGIFIYFKKIHDKLISPFAIIKKIQTNHFKFFLNSTYSFVYKITSIIALSISSQILLFPVILYYFERFSLISIFANIPIVILAEISISLSFLILFLSFFSDFLVHIYMQSLNLSLYLIKELSEIFNTFKDFSLLLEVKNVLYIYIYFLILIGRAYFWEKNENIKNENIENRF